MERGPIILAIPSQAGMTGHQTSVNRNNIQEIPSSMPQKAFFFLHSYHCGIATIAGALFIDFLGPKSCAAKLSFLLAAHSEIL